MSTNLSEYKKKQLSQQILDEPDTYVGGCDEIDDDLPLIKGDNIIISKCKYKPVFIKLLDEILINARDQYVRLNESNSSDIIKVSTIKVDYNKENGMWSIYNDGNGIDVAKHPTELDSNGEPYWIPSLILGELLTSKNYNKKGKTTGGKNGFGAKLVNLFSKWFKVETVDHIRGLKFVQEFKGNMSIKEKPKVTNVKRKPYTKISWIVDFDRFFDSKYSNDMVNLMVRRVYDIAGVTDSNVNIYYNNKKLPIKSFNKYIDLYLKREPKIYEKISDRWEIGVSLSETDTFQQISFVNGIFTYKGGKHVDLINKLIIEKISAYINKKYKESIPDNYIKNHLYLFINCVIEDPSFDSQSKERLITTKSKFGSTPKISDKFIKKIISDTNLIEKVLSFSDFKKNKIASKSNGSKTAKIKNIPKLDDANFAGTKQSELCSLILTEGDSAKTMAISGLKKIGRDKYGIYPLKGKILNVKDISIEQILKNSEIKDIIKILGLEINKEYKNTEKLRYGKILIMTDQDHDGSHIKALLLNIFHTLWPSLLDTTFISSMITPIIKVSKNKECISFYNLADYEKWKLVTSDYKNWKCKYYKGLGTSTAKEAIEYFENNKIMKYINNDTKLSDESINLAFKKDLSNKRKDWLYNYDSNEILNPDTKEVPICEFINKELIHFSNADTLRSIASVIDGLKPSQRKILYSCFKRKLYSEIKVAQLSGYVSENSAYHHGEMSLQSTIIGMAQNYVGSNNINILEPNGQFGSRIMGGHDSASSRYIFTELNKLTNYIFPKDDFPLLSYTCEDGETVEPTYYIPIIPFTLINGVIGIGTGFSSLIPKYNPLDIITNVKRKIKNIQYKLIHPWFRGFKGSIQKVSSISYITKGVYRIINNVTIEITELPIGTWTNNYKNFLDGLIYDKLKHTKPDQFYIKDYIDNSDDIKVSFIITLKDNSYIQNIKCINEHIDSIENLFKLTTTKNTALSNIHLYNHNNVIQKYNSIYQIFDEHYQIRYELYVKRKNYILENIKNELNILESKLRFITYVIEDKIIVYKSNKKDIIELLKHYNFPLCDGKNILTNTDNFDTKYYNYLLSIQIHQFTTDKVKELSSGINQLKFKYDNLLNKSIEDIWIEELDKLYEEYNKYFNE